MKYYTKKWYELMQKQHYTSGLQKIPDKAYSDQEIQAFYDADLATEVAHDREIYDTAPNYDWYESQNSSCLQTLAVSTKTFCCAKYRPLSRQDTVRLPQCPC